MRSGSSIDGGAPVADRSRMRGIGDRRPQRLRFAAGIGRLLVIAALPCLAACATMDSLKPILSDSDAVAVPGLVGSWGTGDSTAFEIRQVAERPPTYLAVFINEINVDGGALDTSWSRAIHGVMGHPSAVAPDGYASAKRRWPITASRNRPTWFDVRIGRLAGRLIADAVPSMDADTALSSVVKDYGQIRLTHVAVALELRQDTLLVFMISPDSAWEALKRKHCVSPFMTWPNMFAPPDIEFTGATDGVRRSYECLMRQPGVVSAAGRLYRMSLR